MTTLIGIAAGLVCIIISILLDGSLMTFFDIPSIFVVFGGVIASTLASFPMPKIKSTAQAVKSAFSSKALDFNADVEMILNIANIARREGILALEDMTNTMEDPFLKKGIMLIVDGSDPELIKGILETELSFIQERHAENRSILDSMSAYSPAYGMVGTLIGLINMLKKLDDPSSIGPSMSVALVTTFYGVVLANLIFTPLSKKLKSIGSQEYLRKEMIMEGLLSIQDGENPRIIKEKLNAFLSRAQLKEPQTSLNEEKKEYANV